MLYKSIIYIQYINRNLFSLQGMILMEIVKEQKTVKRGNGSQQGGVIALQPNVKRKEEKRKERYN